MRKTVRQMSKSLKQSRFAVFARDERGAALIEYALLTGMISAVMVVLVFWVGDWIVAAWQKYVDALSTVVW